MLKVLENIDEEFDRQMDILTHVEHDHLVKLVGLCQETQPIYMVLEYTDWVSCCENNDARILQNFLLNGISFLFFRVISNSF